MDSPEAKQMSARRLINQEQCQRDNKRTIINKTYKILSFKSSTLLLMFVPSFLIEKNKTTTNNTGVQALVWLWFLHFYQADKKKTASAVHSTQTTSQNDTPTVSLNTPTLYLYPNVSEIFARF